MDPHGPLSGPRKALMDLEELQAFLHVVEQGSFHAAADTMGMSRTTLRRRIDSLQSRAGVTLLESSRNGVVLTEPGRVLAERGHAMVEEASALVASIREIGRVPSGILRTVMPVGMPPMIMAQLFSSLRRDYPQLRVHCRFSNDPLSESLIDVDMVTHFGETEPRGAWISLVLMRIEERLFASTSYLAAHGTPTTIEELSRHELLAWLPPGEDATAWPLLSGGTFPIKPVYASTDVHQVRQFCHLGLGIAMLPDMFGSEIVSPNELIPVLPSVVGHELAVRVTVPEALADIPKIKMILAHARRFLNMVKAP